MTGTSVTGPRRGGVPLGGPLGWDRPRELVQVTPDDIDARSAAVLTLLRGRELLGKTRATNANRLERGVVDGFAQEIVPRTGVAGSVEKGLESHGNLCGVGRLAPPGQPHDERDDRDKRGECEENDDGHVNVAAYRRTLRRGRDSGERPCATGGRLPGARSAGSGHRDLARCEPVADTRDALRGRESRSAELEGLVG